MEAAIWGNCKCVPDREKIGGFRNLRQLATPRKIVEKAGTLYVVVNQMDGSVVITSVKIIYHMNTVGCDVLRIPNFR